MPRTSLRALGLAALALLASAGALLAHDLFLKPEAYFPKTHSTVQVSALNGTFTTSENAIARARIADLSVVGPDGRQPLDTARWSAAGSRSVVSVRVESPGTYVVGLSTRPSTIALAGAAFAEYLEEEGLDDVLAERTRRGVTADSARERYSKHVKTVLQVGAAGSPAHATVFGYPAELVPLDNPYAVRRGGRLRVRCLVDGKPAAGVTVLAGGRTPSGARLEVQRARADADGVATVTLVSTGEWYVKFIHMAAVPGDSLDYESKWATLTFAVR